MELVAAPKGGDGSKAGGHHRRGFSWSPAANFDFSYDAAVASISGGHDNGKGISKGRAKDRLQARSSSGAARRSRPSTRVHSEQQCPIEEDNELLSKPASSRSGRTGATIDHLPTSVSSVWDYPLDSADSLAADERRRSDSNMWEFYNKTTLAEPAELSEEAERRKASSSSSIWDNNGNLDEETIQRRRSSLYMAGAPDSTAPSAATIAPISPHLFNRTSIDGRPQAIGDMCESLPRASPPLSPSSPLQSAIALAPLKVLRGRLSSGSFGDEAGLPRQLQTKNLRREKSGQIARKFLSLGKKGSSSVKFSLGYDAISPTLQKSPGGSGSLQGGSPRMLSCPHMMDAYLNAAIIEGFSGPSSDLTAFLTDKDTEFADAPPTSAPQGKASPGHSRSPSLASQMSLTYSLGSQPSLSSSLAASVRPASLDRDISFADMDADGAAAAPPDTPKSEDSQSSSPRSKDSARPAGARHRRTPSWNSVVFLPACTYKKLQGDAQSSPQSDEHFERSASHPVASVTGPLELLARASSADSPDNQAPTADADSPATEAPRPSSIVRKSRAKLRTICADALVAVEARTVPAKVMRKWEGPSWQSLAC